MREGLQLTEQALVRARIMYFHQIGYYALQIREDPERRRALALRGLDQHPLHGAHAHRDGGDDRLVKAHRRGRASSRGG